ncbi:MAG: universal stress protein [Devosiaceae bacterium]|nr:universal stress protein [Devosiaceae bacterium]
MQKNSQEYCRKFLVVIDDTDECDRAVTFAAYRVKRTGGTVKLLAIIEPDQFQHWLGVEQVMRAEALEKANELLELRTKRIKSIGNIAVETVVREGKKANEVEKLINEDQAIAILVLASGTSSEGPGPLVSAFASRSTNALPIPVTIIPGGLSDEKIIALC